MQNRLAPFVLEPVINIGTSNFAVRWDQEKTGLPGQIIDYSLSERDEEKIPFQIQRKKDRYRAARADMPDELISEDEDAVLSQFLAEEYANRISEDEEDELYQDKKPTQEQPELYYYNSEGVSLISTTEYMGCSRCALHIVEENDYRFRGRNYTRRIPLHKRERKKCI
jgi:hypothetical protein